MSRRITRTSFIKNRSGDLPVPNTSTLSILGLNTSVKRLPTPHLSDRSVSPNCAIKVYSKPHTKQIDIAPSSKHGRIFAETTGGKYKRVSTWIRRHKRSDNQRARRTTEKATKRKVDKSRRTGRFRWEWKASEGATAQDDNIIVVHYFLST